MPPTTLTPDLARHARLAGLLYLVVIVTGLGAELCLRGPLIAPGDAQATADAILAAPGRFRMALAADLVMAICDAGLAVLLYLVFRAIAPGLALAALVFRLIQTVLIAVSLMALLTAWLVLARAEAIGEAPQIALVFLDLHAHGYDLGLVFFGLANLILAAPVRRSGFVAAAFGAGLAGAGLVYLVGSGLRFFAPELLSAFLPAYALPILAETAFCLRLLFPGRPATSLGPISVTIQTTRRDTMTERGFTVRALGEIAIHCVDYPAMVAFYRDVIGLAPMRDPEGAPIAFFRIAEGFGGHTAVLALFRHDTEGAGRVRAGDRPPATGPGSSLHHIALSLPWNEQDAVIAWYEALGLRYHVETFDWVGWRGVFTVDPDGNTVELVAKEPGWTAPPVS